MRLVDVFNDWWVASFCFLLLFLLLFFVIYTSCLIYSLEKKKLLVDNRGDVTELKIDHGQMEHNKWITSSH